MIEQGWGYRLFWVILLGAWLGMALFVVFHLLTVRRLRRHPAMRDRLGVAFLPGWEAQSVAAAVTVPRSFTRFVRTGRLRGLFADCDAVYQHTSRAERCLGRLCYLTFMGSAVLLAICYMVDEFIKP